MRQTVVNPPWAAPRDRSDRLRVLVAGLPEVGVEVAEPGRHDDTALVDPGALVAVEPDDRFEHAVGDDDLAGTLAPRRRVDEPRPRDLEVRDDLADGRVRGERRRRDAHDERAPARR
jgi:hypothetical protein